MNIKILLVRALTNVMKDPESNDDLPLPRAIASALVEKAKEGDTAAIGLILQIAEFEPKEQ